MGFSKKDIERAKIRNAALSKEEPKETRFVDNLGLSLEKKWKRQRKQQERAIREMRKFQ